MVGNQQSLTPEEEEEELKRLESEMKLMFKRRASSVKGGSVKGGKV